MRPEAAVNPLQNGLPANIDAERVLLGSILLDDSAFVEVADALRVGDFSLEKHQRIFRRMMDLYERGEKVDRITLANELNDQRELESVDGLSYLVSLDDGLPKLSNIEGYVKIVKDKASLRQTIAAAQLVMNRALLAQDTPAEILSHAEQLFFGLEESVGTVARGWENPGDIIRSCPGGLDALMSPNRGGTGIVLPWDRLQEQTCGLQRGDLVILAGRPSHGKSAAALQIARRGAEAGAGVAYVSLEMSRESLFLRLVCSVARVDLHKARVGYASKEERTRMRDAAASVESMPLWIEDQDVRTAAAIRLRLKRLQAKQPFGLVVVDHFHLVAGNGGREDERVRYNRIADDFQRQAKEFGVPFVVLSQLSRKCEEERRPPGLSDLKETAKLEENADLVIFVYRPECYGSNRNREELRGKAEFIIAKQRNGPTGKIQMVFRPDITTFEVAAAEEAES